MTGPPLPVEVLAVRPAPGDRRVPLVLADVALGPVRLTCGMARHGRGRGRFVLKLPVMPDRSPGLVLPEELHAAVDLAVYEAIGADPDVRAVLLLPGETWQRG